LPKTKKQIKAKTIKDMRALGIYKKEYDSLIEIYADLNEQYQRALEEFEQSGFQYETETAAGGSKKSPIVATLETLRKDILAYSDRLCLNPKAIETVTLDKPKQSKLAQALSGLSKSG
jgi:P27 family predicted phage terminase small subunit